MSNLEGLVFEVAKRYANEILAETTLPEDVGQAVEAVEAVKEGLPANDGIPPSAPIVTLTPGLMSINVSWEVPAFSEEVAKAHVEYRRAGTSAWTAVGTETNGYTILFPIKDAEGKPNAPAAHEVRVRLEDLYHDPPAYTGLSPYSAIKTAAPISSAAYDIFQQTSTTGDILVDLVGAINRQLLDDTDPAAFAEGAVTALSMATSNNSNLLPLREVDFDQWNPTEIAGWNGDWPPPESAGNSRIVVGSNPQVSEQVIKFTPPVGHTVRVVDLEGRKWLRHIRVGATVGIVPFNSWESRGTVGAQWYIGSAYVRGPVGGTVQFLPQKASDENGTGLANMSGTYGAANRAGMAPGGTYTLSGNPQGERIWFKFQNDPAATFNRMVLRNLVDGQLVDWTRFQLEATTLLKSEPSPWTPGVFVTGVIGARAIMGITAAFSEAVIGTAAIKELMVESLKADKLLADSAIVNQLRVQAGMHLQSGGAFRVGPAYADWSQDLMRLDDTGIELRAVQHEFTLPGDTRGAKITNMGDPFVHLVAYDIGGTAAEGQRRGWHYTAIGAENRRPFHRLDALAVPSDLTHFRNARIQIRGGLSGERGLVSVQSDLRVDEDLTVIGNLNVSGAIATGDLDLSLANFRNPTGTDIQDIVPQLSLQGGTLPGKITLWAGNFPQRGDGSRIPVIPPGSLGPGIDGRLIRNSSISGDALISLSVAKLNAGRDSRGNSLGKSIDVNLLPGRIPLGKLGDPRNPVITKDALWNILRQWKRGTLDSSYTRQGHKHDSLYSGKDHKHDGRYAFDSKNVNSPNHHKHVKP